ncbi:MAG: glycosyltransferase family 39 protein [Acidobacteria bacterium]|nr:glycosyltransferase family 39 protein [Acidobacteriota bacterium]
MTAKPQSPATFYAAKFAPVMVIAVAALALTAPFFRVHKNSMPLTHDLVQHLAVMQDFDTVIRSGVLYPRWLPAMNQGYGNPWMNYYPPGFYYVTSLFHMVFKNWLDVLFGVSLCGFAVSGLTFYRLARLYYGKLPSLLAALFYMAVPYHTLELYWRGAMPEFMGFVLTPLILYFAVQLGTGGKALHYAGLGLCFGLFLLTHIPTAFLLTYLLAFYGLVWALRASDWKIAFRIGLGMVLGFLFSAIYLLPAALETKDIQEHFSTIFPYHTSYLTLLPTDSFGSLINGSFELLAVTLLVIGVTLWALSQARQAASGGELPDESARPGRVQTRLWMLMAIISAFMCTSLSIHISKLLPRIQVATFAWRWLLIVCLFTALMVAATLDALHRTVTLSKAKRWSYRIALGAVLLFNFWFTLHDIMKTSFSHEIHQQPANYLDAGFTPKGSRNPQELPQTEAVVLQPKSGESEIVRWEPTRREVLVQVSTPVTVRLKTYNFLGWSARLDGQPVTLASDPDGVQFVAVPAGEHRLEVSFGNTAARTLGASITGFAALLIVGLWVRGQRARWQGRRASPAEQVAPTLEPQEQAEAVTQPMMAATSTKRVEIAAKPASAWPRKPVLWIAVAILAGLAVIILSWRLFKTSEPAPQVSNRATTAALGVGAEATLQAGNQSSIYVAVDDNALQELMNALPTGDQSKLENLVQQGRLMRVPKGTKVRLVKLDFSKIQVQIVGGAYSERNGWVPESWIQP